MLPPQAGFGGCGQGIVFGSNGILAAHRARSVWQNAFLGAVALRCALLHAGAGERSGIEALSLAPYYLKLRARGLSSTAAFVALSRKLAKVSFALQPSNAALPAMGEPACEQAHARVARI